MLALRGNLTALLDRHEHRVLALMLLVLHVTIWWAANTPMARPLMLVHLGMFLLWQPLWNRNQRIDRRGGVAFTIIVIAFLAGMSWGLITFWQLLLIALLSGRVNVAPRQRYLYLATVVFLVMEFLIGSVPQMFALDTPERTFMQITGVAMFVIPGVMLLLPGTAASQTATTTRAIDFLYGAGVAVLSLTVGLGALVSTLALNTDYPVALIQTVLGLALLFLAAAWLWGPIAGFSGFGQIWERYVQNVGTPFEHWLGELQRSAREATSPERFLKRALDQLLDLHWVCGVEWQLSNATGQLGERSNYAVSAVDNTLHITLFAYRRMGTTLTLHARLLLRLVTHFYIALQREQTLARQTHLQAIYETGARVTHDIKNLLQSLTATTAVLDEGRDSQAAQALVARQLPLLTQRLQLALEKLQSPSAGDARHGLASEWWRGFCERNASMDVAFETDIECDATIPAELFDSVAENLLENARYKSRIERNIEITARLRCDTNGAQLSLTDTGRAIAPHIASALFVGAVNSESGLGIGLFQAARQAQQLGYQLTLARNEDAAVEFVLSKLPSDEVNISDSQSNQQSSDKALHYDDTVRRRSV